MRLSAKLCFLLWSQISEVTTICGKKNLVLHGFFAFEKTKKIFCSLEISYKKKGGVKMKQVFGDELKKIQL
jgi:hypothetical protein